MRASLAVLVAAVACASAQDAGAGAGAGGCDAGAPPAGGTKRDVDDWEKAALDCLEKEHKKAVGAAKHASSTKQHDIASQEKAELDQHENDYEHKKHDLEEREDAAGAAAEWRARAEAVPEFAKYRAWHNKARAAAKHAWRKDRLAAEILACQRWQEAVEKYNPNFNIEWATMATLNCGSPPPPVAPTPAPAPAPFIGLVPPGIGQRA